MVKNRADRSCSDIFFALKYVRPYLEHFGRFIFLGNLHGLETKFLCYIVPKHI